MKNIHTPEEKIVFGIQLALLASFVLAIGGVVAWILNLVLVAQGLQDVPSASIGISIVAIPLFLTLMVVFNYVFWGLLLHQE